jgi:putative membrane protein
MKEKYLDLSDQLAILRTKMANERTLLAYISLFIALLTSGIAIFKLNVLSEIEILGLGLIVISPIVLVLAILRYRHMNQRIRSFYHSIKSQKNDTKHE